MTPPQPVITAEDGDTVPDSATELVGVADSAPVINVEVVPSPFEDKILVPVVALLDFESPKSLSHV
jgi:hypothetical protein